MRYVIALLALLAGGQWVTAERLEPDFTGATRFCQYLRHDVKQGYTTCETDLADAEDQYDKLQEAKNKKVPEPPLSVKDLRDDEQNKRSAWNFLRDKLSRQHPEFERFLLPRRSPNF